MAKLLFAAICNQLEAVPTCTGELLSVVDPSPSFELA
jgi:hypothetical protein